MNIEEAMDINGQLTRAYLCTTLGIGPDNSIPDISLAEMIVASHMVRDKNTIDGEFHCYCDDRAVAALYCLKHYDGCDPKDIEPVAIAEGKALCVVMVKA